MGIFLFIITALFTFNIHAQPIRVDAQQIENTQYQKIQQIVIRASAEQSVIALAENNTANSEADIYVIDDISENLDLNIVSVKISLYKNKPQN